MKEELQSIVAHILEIPKKDVDLVITSDLGHALVDFFVHRPDEETREICESGAMPPKI
jgi:hypothetical protein